MKTGGKIVSFTALAAIAIGLFIFMKQDKTELSSEGYIGKSGIVIEDGKMSPEALLAFGRMSDPQVSPDGKYILYGVSYTSVEDNRSVRNLFICNLDGSDNHQITTSAMHAGAMTARASHSSAVVRYGQPTSETEVSRISDR